MFTNGCSCHHADACLSARFAAGHNFVGTEQILLGLIGESTGIAAKVLKSMGVNLKDTRVEVEKIIGRGSGFVAVEIPFTPRAKRVLELSLEEARQLGGSRLRLHMYAQSCLFATKLMEERVFRRLTASVWNLHRPQLHRHRAHPAGCAAGGRWHCLAGAGGAGCAGEDFCNSPLHVAGNTVSC